MTARTIARTVALALAGAGALVAPAAGAEADEHGPVPAYAPPVFDGHHHRPADLQPLLVRAHQWLGRTHGLASRTGRPRVVSVERWPFRESHGDLALMADAAVAHPGCRVSYAHQAAPAAVDLLRHAAGRRAPVRVQAATLVLHELLHCYDPRAPEGLVDAVAADLVPGFLRHLLGRTVPVAADPADLVNYFSAYGVFARTGRAVGRGYRDPAAAELRRRLFTTWSARNPEKGGHR